MSANITIPKLIHNGLNTQTHDQLITPVNFSAMNKIVNDPENPITAELALFEPVLLFDDILFLLV
jgi:hypothetical protein